MTRASTAQLRAIDLFEGLSEEELEQWADITEVSSVAPGTIVSEQGADGAAVNLVLQGSLDAATIERDGRQELVSEHRAPTWVGAIAALTSGLPAVRMQARGPALVGTIQREPFVELVLRQRAVFDRIMRQVRPVVRRITALEQDRERLASLGTMAAGLAHELNNPAAAAQRAAADLAEALDVLGSTIGHFVESGIERAEAEQLLALQRDALTRAEGRDTVDALDAADAEDAMLERLEQLDVSEPWRLAEPLAAAGLDGDWLERVHELAGPVTDAALRWVAASLTARSLAVELAESTKRMSSLVKAVKSYAYMDRGEVVEVDLHEGLETTLTVLGHKLKHSDIKIKRDYDKTLPRLTVYGSELNQVWTNLLDNAIDAVGGSGTITIATRSDGPCAQVDISDDGPGIPPEVQAHIFDPFFTTKEVGHGTGLGLDTVRRIVVDRHRGSITVDSEPGRTAFHVWLPFERPGV